MLRQRLLRLMLVAMFAMLLLGTQTVFAQLRIVGRISGTIQDPTGAVVPNAQVVLKDVKTGITKNATSTDGGAFLFPDLGTGVYEVTVTMPGFRTALVQNISVSTNQTTDVRVHLEVGQATETVTISEGSS